MSKKKEPKSLDACDNCHVQTCSTCPKRDQLEEEQAKLLEGLERLGWPCRLEELAEYVEKLEAKLDKEKDRKSPINREGRVRLNETSKSIIAQRARASKRSFNTALNEIIMDWYQLKLR